MATIDTIQAPTHGPLFDEQKSTEVAAHIVLRCERRMPLWRLMAKLYLLDRRLIEVGFLSVTEDDYIAVPGIAAVPHGLTVHALHPKFDSPWHHHLELVGHDVQYLATPDRPAVAGAVYKAADKVVSDYRGHDDRSFKQVFFEEAPETFVTEPRPFTQEHMLIALGKDPLIARSEFEEWNAARRARHVRPHGI